MLVQLATWSGEPSWATSLSRAEQRVYYIGFGEARGGKWDYTKMTWSTHPKILLW